MQQSSRHSRRRNHRNKAAEQKAKNSFAKAQYCLSVIAPAVTLSPIVSTLIGSVFVFSSIDTTLNFKGLTSKVSDFNFKVETGETKIVNGKKFFNVQMINCSFLTDKKITILDYENDCDTKNGKNRTIVMVDDNGKKCKFCTNNPTMKNLLNEIADKNGFPFETIIRMEMLNDGIKNYYFT